MAPEGLSAQVREHFAAPHGAGRPLEPGGWVSGTAGSVARGALFYFWLRLEGERIAEAAFEVFGCPSAIASASWLVRWSTGRSLAEADKVRGLEVAGALEMEPAKHGVALLAEDAFRVALRAARGAQQER